MNKLIYIYDDSFKNKNNDIKQICVVTYLYI